jgi:hypothetical protein
MQVSLVNRSGIPVKGGEFVKLHSKYKDSFVVCDYWDIEKIGTVAEAGYPGRWVMINLMNTVNYADIMNTPEIPVGGGDMLKSTYDPDSIEDDAFDMDNMKAGTVNKLVTDTEKTQWNAKLPGTAFSGLAKITVGTSAPVAPAIGDIWIDTN